MKTEKRTLLILCITLGLCAALNMVDNARVIGEEEAATPTMLYVVAASVVDEVLMVLLVVFGLRLLRCEQDDTTDLVNACESLAIASAGMRVVDWLVDVLTLGVLYRSSVALLIVTLSAIIGYYLTVRRFERSSFWDGVRDERETEPLLVTGTGIDELALDAKSGLLRPPRAGEQACLRIMGEDAYVERLSERIAEQVVLPQEDMRHCTCVRMRDAAFGYIHVVREVQRAAGFDAGAVIDILFEAESGYLVLVADEHGPARSFISACLVDQFIAKETAVGFVAEVSALLVLRLAKWVQDYGGRLMLLEERLGENVYKLPQGFTEFVNEARRELSVVHRFCKQMCDVLEDLAEVVESGDSHGTARLCSAVSRQYLRLATDATEVRDLAGEVRVGFHERVELRQNSVMSMLTIVTTVFTPLALVTGWYGMNFTNMPELTLRDAYFVVATLMVMLITLEFAFFKRRRWF